MSVEPLFDPGGTTALIQPTDLAIPLTENEAKRKWLADYIGTLRPELRPDQGDPKFRNAAAAAYANGWDAVEAAQTINGLRYEGAFAPDRVAVSELARVAAAPSRPSGRVVLAPRRSSHQRHCGLQRCVCDHEECLHGWFDSEDGRTTTPCPTCRQVLARRLSEIPPPGQRSHADQAYIYDRYKKDRA